MGEEQFHLLPIHTIIDRICENGPSGEWVRFQDYSEGQLQTIKKMVEHAIAVKGKNLTQQVAPWDDSKRFTYEEVLGRVLVSVNNALSKK